VLLCRWLGGSWFVQGRGGLGYLVFGWMKLTRSASSTWCQLNSEAVESVSARSMSPRLSYRKHLASKSWCSPISDLQTPNSQHQTDRVVRVVRESLTSVGTGHWALVQAHLQLSSFISHSGSPNRNQIQTIVLLPPLAPLL